ncbi:MAG: ISL3 family transposase [Candidatus Omnitrophica bacterium]|nr:ISL3 family transposase [Candidatus Omnitrophota bacterium]
MRDKDLYAQILGIQHPWVVREVDLNLKSGEVRVYVNHDPQVSLRCPECGSDVPGYDTRERQWRHLDTCQYKTILVAEVPRCQCSEHGVHQVEVPWSEPGSRFTILFEALVLDWLREASMAAVSRRLGVSWDQIDGVMNRGVKRGLDRREEVSPKHIGVDETSFKKGHRYVTLVQDQEKGHVLQVEEGRGRESLDSFYENLGKERASRIKSVSMDMHQPYIRSTLEHVSEAEKKICFDKFHVAKHLGDAVDKVRRQEHKQLLREGDETLKGTKYLWLYNPENMKNEAWWTLERLKDSALRTARAWAIKELAMTLWDYVRRGWAEKAWKGWLTWAQRCRLDPMRKAAKTVKNHLWGIINAIVLKRDNARSESLNAKIQKLKKWACGYRNPERFKTIIMFHLGGLDLYPAGIRRS